MSQTPEEKKVNTIINDAKEQIKAVDNTTHYEQPAPEHTPPEGSMFAGPQPGQKMAEEAREQAREAIRQETSSKAAEAIKEVPTDTQAKIFKTVDAFAYPHTAPPVGSKDRKDLDQSQDFSKQQFKGKHKEAPPQKTMDETQRSALHKMGYTDMRIRQEKEKDISQSQDFAMRKLGDEKEKERVPPQKEAEPVKETEPVKKAEPQKEAEPVKEASMSKSFSQSLGYSKLYGSPDKGTESKESKAPMSMSDRFSATLGYNNMVTADAKVSHNPSKETKSKDPDLGR